MPKLVEVCSSCGVRLLERGYTTFSCPGCGESAIGRCEECRNQSVVYSCKECGFQGP